MRHRPFFLLSISCLFAATVKHHDGYKAVEQGLSGLWPVLLTLFTSSKFEHLKKIPDPFHTT
jgi:hypothetical protein